MAPNIRTQCNSCEDPESCFFIGACANKAMEEFMADIEKDDVSANFSILKDFSDIKNDRSGVTENYHLPLELKDIVNEPEEKEIEPIIFKPE